MLIEFNPSSVYAISPHNFIPFSFANLAVLNVINWKFKEVVYS